MVLDDNHHSLFTSAGRGSSPKLPQVPPKPKRSWIHSGLRDDAFQHKALARQGPLPSKRIGTNRNHVLTKRVRGKKSGYVWLFFLNIWESRPFSCNVCQTVLLEALLVCKVLNINVFIFSFVKIHWIPWGTPLPSSPPRKSFSSLNS